MREPEFIKSYATLRQEGVRESVLTDVFRDPGEVCSSLYYLMSILPALCQN